MTDHSDPPQDGSIVCADPGMQQLIETALGNLWAVANDLSRIKPAAPEHYRVTIFGSARIKPAEPLYQDVKRLARVLAERGCDLVSGGGPGLMQAANEGAQEGDPEDKVKSIGIRVELPFEQSANPFVEQLYTHRTFYTRLHQFVRLSNAFVVVGGGIGTLLETTMVWQLLQVRHLHDVPLILVGEMWQALVEWGKLHMVERPPRPFANAADLELPICVPDVERALAVLEPFMARFAAARASR
jgi:uncharacterized protein (TIGR00730 family)